MFTKENWRRQPCARCTVFVHNRVRTSYRINKKNGGTHVVFLCSILYCEVVLIVRLERLVHTVGNHTSLMTCVHIVISIIGMQRNSAVHGHSPNMVLQFVLLCYV